METLTATRLYTYEDLQALDNGNRYELIDGELIVHDNPNVAHQRTVFKLLYNLVQYVRTNKIGEVFPAPLDVRLGPATVIQPDLLVVLAANASRVQNIIEGPPDWVCEILSPSTEEYDSWRKRHLYAKYGVQEYWMIDPLGHVAELWRLEDGNLTPYSYLQDAGELRSHILPGFSVQLADLLA